MRRLRLLSPRTESRLTQAVRHRGSILLVPGIGIPMVMAAIIWLCLAVVILVVVLPLAGGMAALAAILIALVVVAAICFAVCGFSIGYRRQP